MLVEEKQAILRKSYCFTQFCHIAYTLNALRPG